MFREFGAKDFRRLEFAKVFYFSLKCQIEIEIWKPGEFSPNGMQNINLEICCRFIWLLNSAPGCPNAPATPSGSRIFWQSLVNVSWPFPVIRCRQVNECNTFVWVCGEFLMITGCHWKARNFIFLISQIWLSCNQAHQICSYDVCKNILHPDGWAGGGSL